MRDRLLNNRRNLLLAGCGTGKTLASASAIAEIGIFPALIITLKPSLRSVWEDDLLTFFDNVNPIILDKGTSKEKYLIIRDLFRMKVPNAIVVTNYETARLLNLEHFSWGIVIADEGHRLRGHNSNQSVNLAVALKNTPLKTTMTGTSWSDRPTDVFGQVRFLEPKKNGSYWGTETFGSWTTFFERYVIYKERDHIKIPYGYMNQDELAEKIKPYFLYIDRDEVLDLPPEQHVYRTVKLPRDYMKMYRQFEDDFTMDLGGDTMTADNMLVLQGRLHQITSGFFTPDDKTETGVIALKNGEAKADAALGLLEEIGEDEPVVIFYRWQFDLERLSAWLKKADISHRVMGGGVDQHREWNKEGQGRVLLVNIAAGSASVSFTRAHYGIFYSMNFSRTDYLQAVARISRPPQQHKMTFYYLIAEGTVDREIIDRLRTKKQDDEALLKALLTEPKKSVKLSEVLKRR